MEWTAAKLYKDIIPNLINLLDPDRNATLHNYYHTALLASLYIKRKLELIGYQMLEYQLEMK